MNAVDTNVLVYSLDRRDATKQLKARSLLRHLRRARGNTVLLWQVLGEFVRQLRAWLHQGLITAVDLRHNARLYRRFFPVILPTEQVLDRALDLADRYSLSHWDSMLVGACLEAGVDTLYTEDMGSPTTVEGVRLVNPF